MYEMGVYTSFVNLRIVQYHATRVSTGCVQDNETWAETRSGRIETWKGRGEGGRGEGGGGRGEGGGGRGEGGGGRGEGGGGRGEGGRNPRSTEICGIRWERAATVHILALNDITGNKINSIWFDRWPRVRRFRQPPICHCMHVQRKRCSEQRHKRGHV